MIQERPRATRPATSNVPWWWRAIERYGIDAELAAPWTR